MITHAHNHKCALHRTNTIRKNKNGILTIRYSSLSELFICQPSYVLWKDLNNNNINLYLFFILIQNLFYKQVTEETNLRQWQLWD